MSDKIVFQYANECELESHCSPFGVSGFYVKIKGTNVRGIGSTMGTITGSTKGLIHYNNAQDFMNLKYKLYVIKERDNSLRIDFTKISESLYNDNNSGLFGEVVDDADPTLVFTENESNCLFDSDHPFIGIFSFETDDQ